MSALFSRSLSFDLTSRNLHNDHGSTEAALFAYERGIAVGPQEYRNVVSCCRMLEQLGFQPSRTRRPYHIVPVIQGPIIWGPIIWVSMIYSPII